MRTTISLLLLIAMHCVMAQNYSNSRIIVKLKSTKSSTSFIAFDALNKKYNCSALKQMGTRSNKFFKTTTQLSATTPIIIKFSSPVDVKTAIQDYNNTGLFEYVEPDYKGKGGSTIPNDPIFATKQYYHVNNGSFTEASANPAKVGADMDTDLAWDITTGNPNVILGVFDTGLNLTHPEYTGRHYTNPGEIAGNGLDDDGNGYIDDVSGYDFVNNDNNPTDDQGHGSNVTGIAAATGNNGVGMAGMDWKCKIMTLKVLDNNNNGWYSDWSEALYYAADLGIHVANMSLYGTSYSNSLKAAVDYAHNKGVLVVVCMGNDNTGTAAYPAGYSNAMAVGALNPDDTRVEPATYGWGSNYGNHISVTAPGNVVYSTRYNSTALNYWMGGTSQATPQVAGLACLIKGKDMSKTNTQIRSIIESTAEDQVGTSWEDVAGFDNYYGHGRINAYQALSTLLTSNNSVHSNTAKVFPNPSSGYLNIFTNSATNKTITVYNTQGKMVKQEQTTLENYQIQLPPAPGLYHVQVRNNNSEENFKVIKK